MQQPDRRRRSKAAALTPNDRQHLIAAFKHGCELGFPPSTTIDFHPACMNDYPERELSAWFKDEFRNRITTWLRRRDVGWYAIWVRENYAGDRREHIHLMIHCPRQFHADLETAIHRWFPGRPEMLKIGAIRWRINPTSGRLVCGGLDYRLKQMTSTAQGPPWPGRPWRETKHRHDKSPVASVDGLRCGVSRTLDRKARAASESPGQGLPSPGHGRQTSVAITGLDDTRLRINELGVMQSKEIVPETERRSIIVQRTSRRSPPHKIKPIFDDLINHPMMSDQLSELINLDELLDEWVWSRLKYRF